MQPPLYHISFKHRDSAIWQPTTPDGLIVPKLKTITTEPTTPRICVSETLEGCLRAIWGNINKLAMLHPYLDFHVYQPRLDVSTKLVDTDTLTKSKLVWDAWYTKEWWITSPVSMDVVGKLRLYKPTPPLISIHPFNDPKLPALPHSPSLKYKTQPVTTSHASSTW